MLRLVNSEAECSNNDTSEERQPVGEPQQASDAQLKQLAGQLFMQLPMDPRQAAAVIEHLSFLARWRGGALASADQAAKAAQRAALLLMLMTCTADEEGLAGQGFRGRSSTYASTVLLRGFLGDGFAIA